MVWYFYKKGSNAPIRVIPPQDNPNSTSSTNNPVGLSDSNIKLIVDNAHADYSSYVNSFFGHNADLYIPLAQMSDTDFVKAYDIWNNEFQSKDGVTMRGAIDSIWGTWADGIIIGDATSFSSIRNVMDDKFSRLNLT